MRYAKLFLLGLTVLGGWLAWSPGSSAADSVEISSGDNWFCDSSNQFGVCDTTIQVGDSVTWTYPQGITVHTTTECDSSCDFPTVTPLWDSGFMFPGDTFSKTFNAAGTFLYYCTLHPSDMRGTVTVVEAPTPTPTPAPPTASDERDEDADASAIATPHQSRAQTGGTPRAVAALPPSGGPAADTDTGPAALMAGALLAAAGLAVWIAARKATGRGRR